MTNTKEKKVVLSIDNVRIIAYDDLNYAVVRDEPVKDTGELKERFKGYVRSIKGALDLIIRKELLVDMDSVYSVGTYIEEHQVAVDKVTQTIEEVFGNGKK